MTVSIFRSVGSVVAALVLAFVMVVGWEVFSEMYHPFPAGADKNDLEVCKAHVANYPPAVLAPITAGWALTVLLAAWLATRLGTGRHPAHGLVVGAILLAFAALNMAMLPYPVWFPIVNLVSFPLGALCGARLGRGPSPSRRDSTQ